MFVAGMEGTLMELAAAPETRFRYLVWFDYTRRAINEIQEGTLLAVPNFAGDSATVRYSVLEVAAILPVHYALQGGTSGYPGFVVEAARSASEDWETQETSATEETTKIHVVAIPTNLEIVEPTDGAATIGTEGNVGMVGAKVRILDTEYSNLIANCGIDRKHEKNLIVVGTMARDDKVEILLRVEELYRTHFAVFGFTGVGKSNLLSTVVSTVLTNSQDPLKIVFFDLLSEYTVLLLDELLDTKVHARILTIGRRTLPEGVFRHINGMPGAPSLDEAARQFGRYTLLPKGLARQKPIVDRALRDLIQQKKLAFFNEAQSLTVWDLFFTNAVGWAKDRRESKREQRHNMIKSVLRKAIPAGADYKTLTFSPDLARKLRAALEEAIDQTNGGEFKDDCVNHLAKLEDLERSTAESYAAGVSLDQMVADLNDQPTLALDRTGSQPA